jgi:GT2 family glycosyltransferase
MRPDRTPGPAGPLDILIVIVNYRTAGLTIDCLRSLEPDIAEFRDGRVRAVVADNASPDDSVARLEAAVRENRWDGWVEVRPLERNGGFAYGNNAVIRPALDSATPPDYFWLLNPDTVVRPGALRGLIDFLRERPEVGIAGSRLEDPDGSAQRSTFRFPSIMGELESGLKLGPASRLLGRWIVSLPAPDAPIRCDWVSGASMMVRRDVFEAAGLLDEGYFMYYEEVDLCRRALLAGWPCWYTPRARVVHLVGQSSAGGDPQAGRKRLPPYWFESRRRYFLAHLGRAPTILADVAWSTGFLTFRARQRVQRKPDNEPQYMLRDFVRHNLLPSRRSRPRP